MAEEEDKFRAAFEKLRSGSDEAIWSFIAEYGPAIRRIARRNMDRRMQSQFDSVDFVQMVWVSFFRHPREIRSFQRAADLHAYLGRMVKNKVCDEHRKHLGAAKRDVTRERPLDACEEPQNVAESTPSQVAIAREMWHRMLDGETDKNRRIAKLRLGGATIADISRQLQINEKTVRNVIDRLMRSYRADGKG